MIKVFDNFFTNEECNDAVKAVLDNEPNWYKCSWTSMYILGNSLFRKISFNESVIDYGNYFQSDFFDTPAVNLLKQKLETIYNRVEFIPSFSRPGFQIIKLNEDKNPGVWHYDNMITCYPFERVFNDYTGNFNEYFDQKLIFTTMLTDGRFTFDYYPETVSQFGKDFFDTSLIAPHCQGHRNLVGDNCPNLGCPLVDFKTMYYKKGTMLLQDERFLHRVGMKDLDGSANLRISLQGYGLVKNNILYLVW